MYTDYFVKKVLSPYLSLPLFLSTPSLSHSLSIYIYIYIYCSSKISVGRSNSLAAILLF